MTAVTANGEKRVFYKVKRQIYGGERSVLRICLCISCMHRMWTREPCVAHRVSVLNIALPVEFYCYVDEINWWCMAAYISAQTIPATGNGVPACGNGVPATGNDGNELWVSTLFKIRHLISRKKGIKCMYLCVFIAEYLVVTEDLSIFAGAY